MPTRDKDYYKKRVFDIIEVSKDNDIASTAYDIMITFAVIDGLLPLTIKGTSIYTNILELFSTFIFIVDYSLRIYTSDYKMGVKSYKAYIANLLQPMSIIDLISIVPVISVFFPRIEIIRILKIFRIVRIFKLLRYSKTMRNITNVIRRVKKPLFAVLVLTAIYITASAMFIYQIEPNLFNSFFDALYWATISITTIGYGDISPVTTPGRFITMISALVGVAVIALPSGIITAGFMEEIKKKKSKLEL
ncbi:MAG: ion transporter [Lachnospiraceae bacterium]|nr:ion transporter [Lachnospiraceae bacterium]